MNQQQIFINVPKHNPQQLEIVTVPVEVQLRNQLPMGNVSFVLVQSTEVDEIALRLRYEDAVASCHSNQGNEEDTEPMDID
ncbi:uncharacterized protein LOC124450510 isoform X3 [Xenia sp. Carnegie-2017]|uniref:uncharacterized protein LOC124450510 isoform X3 n=1 Tax=Xenia sp. Carnegie-2017 TaxID=2897299 RepID=UPI001F037D48|nr:uncharacterized protein LOC124450510 isoform X3 [Xenia sp. Carnegie-2017]